MQPGSFLYTYSGNFFTPVRLVHFFFLKKGALYTYQTVVYCGSFTIPMDEHRGPIDIPISVGVRPAGVQIV